MTNMSYLHVSQRGPVLSGVQAHCHTPLPPFRGSAHVPPLRQLFSGLLQSLTGSGVGVGGISVGGRPVTYRGVVITGAGTPVTIVPLTGFPAVEIVLRDVIDVL